ncbi:endonuclease [Vibrio sp. 10N.286.49.C2]|uniref:endonuclease III domain-containing protein n=1 Tax=unclassified Vibrio TaxID=2614977 RepID=UPI000C86522A|nr:MULTISPECIES: endonuclease [unclassified Vibrio]PMH35140.1 endonuclease [Vibrio sp. 10N.286.49.C2]PMH57084.1 endonuclease [Vibrio sp. 10N.286.49.B1]PMH77889.1 endonuclease [Vibrio sp. 10N.286.48.B7]
MHDSINHAHQIPAIQQVFQTLEHHYGWFDWWATPQPYEIMVGSVLVQNTTWKNAEKALHNLGHNLTPNYVASLPLEELANKIRSSGYYNQKALKLKALTQWYALYGYDMERVRAQTLTTLRSELLDIKGVGGETADVILVYVIGKPSFVIDAYARRIVSRNGITVPRGYDAFRLLMESALSVTSMTPIDCEADTRVHASTNADIDTDTRRYAYYHGLIVEHGQQFCNKVPNCGSCPLGSSCPKIGV